MNLSRREFNKILAIAGASGLLSNIAHAKGDAGFYNIPNNGDVRLLHITDSHAQLTPIYFREPSTNLGFNGVYNQAPHLVAEHLLNQFNIKPNSELAHAFTSINFSAAAKKYGKVGGYAHLKTLVDRLRGDFGQDKTLLLDGGDTWQGSGTAYWTQGMDMVNASNLLGVDVMTGHWEFTYQDEQILKNIKAFNGDFVAQNVKVKEDSLFDGVEAYDEDTGHAFKPYVIKELNGYRIAVVGQAFPYTPVANPQRFIPDWTFGINDRDMQEVVDQIRASEKPHAVVVLSHNGMDVDLKMASRVTGIDAILGGHTHDGVPRPVEVANASGKTLVMNAGSNGKFVGVLDLKFSKTGVSGYEYKLLPVFSNLLEANNEMQNYIDEVRSPYLEKLQQPLGIAGDLLYRRGNFNGTFDQLICDALTTVNDAEISLSPGFRWGTTVLPGQTITMEHVLDQTCITYPETYVREMKGSDIKAILEDVADNLFNPDPYYQQGGDMVRVGGLDYQIDPLAKMSSRIDELTLDNGKKLQADKLYKVAGWATVGSKSPGEPVWDTVATYLKSHKTVNIKKLNTPVVKNIAGNKGIV